MSSLVFLLLAYVGVVLVVFPIWALLKLRAHADKLAELQVRLDLAEAALQRKKSSPETTLSVAAPLNTAPSETFFTPPECTEEAASAGSLPPLADSSRGLAATEATPQIEPPPVEPPVIPPAPTPSHQPRFNWEQFMGAKLFAWLGGFALFLGVVFFVKYSFEHNLISPEVRVALGFALGAGLVIGGLRLAATRYRITSQTLIAAGVVSLYAVTFACNSIYHFAFFGQGPTFLLMALITTVAFFCAVRLRAHVVALLGMLGGFLTPLLLSTGVDNPGGLFGYLALLDAGLVAVMLATSWRYLVPLSAGCTALMILAWSDRFFTVANGPTAMLVCLGFGALYFAAAEWARRRDQTHPMISWTAAAMLFLGHAFAFYFLSFPEFAQQALLWFGYVLVVDVALLALAWRDDSLPMLHGLAGLAVFALLAQWTAGFVTDAQLPSVLGFYLVFAALHTAFPLLVNRLRPEPNAREWSQFFPALTLVLLLVPLLELTPISFVIWPAVLVVNLLAVIVAVVAGSLLGLVAVIVLTLGVTGCALLRVPVGVVLEPLLLLPLLVFAVFFFVVCLWLGRRLPAGPATIARGDVLTRLFGGPRAQLPALAVLPPFLLLVLVCARLSVPDPSLVFGLALLLTVLALGLTRLMQVDWLPAVALAGVVAVEYAWRSQHFEASATALALTWYAVFTVVFLIFPFVFLRRMADRTGPWAVAALVGVVQFPLFYALRGSLVPERLPGLLPAAFGVVWLVALVVLLRRIPAESPARLNQLAWFGGVALLFITLVFPIQFDRQWLTLAWALEGAALCWLYHRVPHPGLRGVGVVLLAVAFVRLALNPAVLSYHVRGELPLLNWWLWTYGLAIAALFTAARLLAPPRERVFGMNLPPLLQTGGVVLLFLLLNIEIADFYTPVGARAITLQFSDDFARDLTYTITWALFALGLLGAGLWKKQPAARYAALGLLSVTLLKLFFHDLARLEALYRVGALFAVAVIAIFASFVYQRFLPPDENPSANSR
ncbi:MAG: DUF2339 domain-containing protein [Candidatus Didemnitutus sp.]|nr:DUF2339 domain-containing protein [Candidatus Didemnitutus sp.]